jgi:hypothetical protein
LFKNVRRNVKQVRRENVERGKKEWGRWGS